MPGDALSAEAVSLDCFGTLVEASRPEDPAAEIAAALDEEGVAVPDDWATAYREAHLDRPPGAETPLHAHVAAAVASHRPSADPSTLEPAAERAVRRAFDAPVRTRPGAAAAVDALSKRGRVGVLSNCSVPGLVGRAIGRSAVDADAFDAVTTSVDCGWRKPDPRAFSAAADALSVDVAGLVHVGDDPTADGGATDAGARALLIDEVPLDRLAATVEERWR